MTHDTSGAPEIDVDELEALLQGTDAPALIDVREADEQANGILAGASLIPLAGLPARVAQVPGARQRPIVIYCAGGVRSAAAVLQLRLLGYGDARSLRGGFTAWQRRGRPWVLPAGAVRDGLDVEQRERYSRHLRLPEVGVEGQRRLLEARVLCVGAGGLGSPASLYLAAAGVGTIGLVDDDKVELSNLQRQIIHSTGRIGMAKVASAARTLQSLNPGTRIRPIEARLATDNALDVMAEYDVIVDGSDNLATRYLVNDYALRLGKPVVHGAVLRFEGHVGLFTGQPCYRCLFPEAPPAELAPSCAEAGVLGVLPGVIGVLQATEAIKWILGIGDSLRGRLLTFDALSMRFSELRVAADPQCPACSANRDGNAAAGGGSRDRGG